MKKLFLILVASVLMVQLSNAQMFSYGIKGGVGFSSISIDDVQDINSGSEVYDLVTGEGVAGYHVGVQTKIKIAMFHVQPELYWNAGGGTVEKVVDGGATEIMNVKFNRIDIPVLAGVSLGPLRLNIGPVASIVVGEENDFLAELGEDFDIYSETLNWGWQGGVGVGLGGLSLDLRYEGPLSDLNTVIPEGTLPDDMNLDARPKQWIISLGYWF